jgi:hypothetical protein
MGSVPSSSATTISYTPMRFSDLPYQTTPSGPVDRTLGVRTRNKAIPFPGFSPERSLSPGPSKHPHHPSTAMVGMAHQGGQLRSNSNSPLRKTSLITTGNLSPQRAGSIRPRSATVTTTRRPLYYLMPSSSVVVETGGDRLSVSAHSTTTRQPWSGEVGPLGDERLPALNPEWRPPVDLSSPVTLGKFRGERAHGRVMITVAPGMPYHRIE